MVIGLPKSYAYPCLTIPRSRNLVRLLPGDSWTFQDASTLWNTIPSELALFVLLNFFVSALAMTAVLVAALFLGRLSATEFQRLSHRLIKYAVFKMVFLGSIISPDPRDFAVWLAWFAVVGYLRVFLGAAKDRLESLMSSPGAQLGRHARGVCLLLLVLLCNGLAFAMVMKLLAGQSLARLLLCAFDSAVVTIEGLKTLLRYVVNMVDRYQSMSGFNAAAAAAAVAGAGAAPPAAVGDNDEDLPTAAAAAAVMNTAGGGGGWDLGWPGKGNFLYHAELVADVLVHAVTLAHYLHVWVMHGLSFHFIDAMLFLDMRTVLLSLLRRLRSHLSYRAATQRLNTTFRDVHPSALVAAGGGATIDCTICMDEIVHVAKQLPCGHVFHLSCLRAWLQQSGSESFTCPNCRKPILVGEPGGGGGGGRSDGGGGQRRQWESDWWIVRMWDRLYLRLVVALEPLLLTLLISSSSSSRPPLHLVDIALADLRVILNMAILLHRLLLTFSCCSITLWLGGRTQARRRSARPPSSPREGFGESPWPAAAAAAAAGPSRGRRQGRRRRSALTPAEDSSLEYLDLGDDVAAAAHDLYDDLYDDGDDEVVEAEEGDDVDEADNGNDGGDGGDGANYGGEEDAREREGGLQRGANGEDRDSDAAGWRGGCCGAAGDMCAAVGAGPLAAASGPSRELPAAMWAAVRSIIIIVTGEASKVANSVAGLVAETGPGGVGLLAELGHHVQAPPCDDGVMAAAVARQLGRTISASLRSTFTAAGSEIPRWPLVVVVMVAVVMAPARVLWPGLIAPMVRRAVRPPGGAAPYPRRGAAGASGDSGRSGSRQAGGTPVQVAALQERLLVSSTSGTLLPWQHLHSFVVRLSHPMHIRSNNDRLKRIDVHTNKNGCDATSFEVIINQLDNEDANELGTLTHPALLRAVRS
ncbi:hypothetical protein VOLCADRAFT_94007 [Volvox carteri f. nagariensis]|uniref:RING-type domain-containing protein n=1 Tax=Volvox carteri f. nagariensis TaxID=3068 RepID=D8U3N4_VOLCA|nr:uncharacterized protein VOLCADRAFT_94007 [Volvox carteri f. nagariensis]EFJ45639.1 hypothetical protein VOLCADRAFT_94007 [Volvox carteri f. nagariensis]|eukprot:XP_002953329.1 hypothetical protein VOLCADRAFT_94007 [Volvox carteri f. nagariensis]